MKNQEQNRGPLQRLFDWGNAKNYAGDTPTDYVAAARHLLFVGVVSVIMFGMLYLALEAAK